MGEPLGDSATYRKADGGLVLGGGGSSTPSSTTVSSTELPDWAKGYAKDTLANAANLTDINKNPYQTYSQPRIAGFAPMQEQAQTAASNMSAGPDAFQQNMGAYMSPYMQNVVDVQKQEAARQSGIMGTQQQAQAAQAGAFGGGRDAIMRAERERNLGQQMNQIQAQGSQAAYDQAANQFRQGLTQDVAINQLQNQYGGQQQQQAQRGLDLGYQDFLNQQNYPYKQIGFMSDLVRGLPLGQQSTAQIYQAPPSAIQTVGALGMGAYGAKQMGMFADGGQVDSYAGGGEINAMNDQNQMADAVDKLTDEQLQQIIRNPSSAAELEAAKMELATRASERSGLAGAYNMAQGGVVAFKDGDVVSEDAVPEIRPANPFAVDSDYDDDETYAFNRNELGSKGNESLYNRFGTRLEKALNDNDAAPGISLRSDQQMEDAALARFGRLNERIGGDKSYTDIQKQIADMRGENEGSLREGKGLAALQAAGAMLQGNDPMRGLGAAGSAFASAYAPALAAKRRADQSFTEMNINLAKAQRAEKAGLLKEADAYTQSAEANKINANKAATLARKAGLEALAQAMRATKPQMFRPAAAARPNVDALAQEAFLDAAQNPDDLGKQQKAESYAKMYGLSKPAVAAAGVAQTGANARSAADIAADEEKQRKELEEKRKATRLELEKTVAAEYTGSKLALEPAYQEALTNAARKVKGAKTPDEVRLEIIAREVERRASASAGAGASKQKVIKLD
jgi:hypothetical protein